MKRQVRINYRDLRDADIGYLASTVLQALGENSEFFTDPNPSLEELELAVADYNGKMSFSNRKGSLYDSEAKNVSRKELEEVLRRLAFYVNTTANGVVYRLLSSGFRLRALRGKLPVPGIPDRARLVDGNLSGELMLLFDPVHKASEYEYQFGTMSDGDIHWGEVTPIRNGRRGEHNIIGSLTPAMTYYTRVRARNAHAIGDWSAPVSQIAR